MRLWMKLTTIISLSFGSWLAAPFCPAFDDLFADLFHTVLILHMKYKYPRSQGKGTFGVPHSFTSSQGGNMRSGWPWRAKPPRMVVIWVHHLNPGAINLFWMGGIPQYRGGTSCSVQVCVHLYIICSFQRYCMGANMFKQHRRRWHFVSVSFEFIGGKQRKGSFQIWRRRCGSR